MTSEHRVSIIICTCNRAAALRQTLEAFRNARIPAGWKAELIVADNGSTDETSAVAGNCRLPNIEVRTFREPARGKSNALNSSLDRALGEILLFTDDDVSVREDWVERMVGCLAQGGADAAVGRIELAQHLRRSWMDPSFEGLLAVSDFKSGAVELVGANAGFRRAVLGRVPRFDPELGPGMLGLGEETLFSWQLLEAGFKLVHAPDAVVVHQPDASRLLRGSWLASARSLGRSRAYLLYHWKQEDIRAPRMQWLWMASKLGWRRLLQPPQSLDSEGCPPWELSYVWHLEMYKQFCANAGDRETTQDAG